MKYLFIFSCLIFNINIYAQNIQITHQNSINHIDNFYINQVKNQATLYAFEDIEVSSKLIEKYLNQGFEVIIKTNKNIEISNSIYFNYSKKGALKFICEDTGTIQISDFAKIESKNAELNISLITFGQILIHPKSKIITNGGDIKLQAFENTKRLKRDPRSSIEISGTIDASGLRGGKITVESDKIEAKNKARILSKGAFGGGKILIGGDWQGGIVPKMKETEKIYEAIAVSVEKGAVIDASATQKGNGGKIVVWSNINHPRSNTFVKGDFYAKGGKISGKGGQIETSGGAVDFEKINVSTIAADGSAGEWLIDPWNFYFNSNQLNTLASNLNNNNVTISTWSSPSNDPSSVCGEGFVVFLDNFTYSGSNARTLTIDAHRHIWINGNITSTGGGLSINLNPSNGQSVLFNGDIATNGGALTVGNAANIHFQKTSGSQTVNTNGGAINFGNSNVKLLRHNGTLSLNSGAGSLGLGGSGTIDQTNIHYSMSTPLHWNGWGGAHVNGQKDYIAITAGKTYSTRMFFWDSWDGERGELVVFENSTNQWRYYFTAHRTNNGVGNEMSNIVSNFGTQYLITGPSHMGRGSWTDVYVDITFTAAHNGTLRTWNYLDQADSDESLELFNIWETQFSDNSNYTTGSRSLELISTSGQLACGTKNFSGLANITFNTNNNDGFVEGIISGTTNVTKSGTGRVRFSGKNTYTGTTTVSGGTYRFVPWFTGDVALSGAFTNNAIVTYESGNVNNRPTIYLDGGISGSGTWNISSDVAPVNNWSNRLSFRSTASTSGQINISSHGNLWFEGSNINTTSPIFLDGANARLRIYGPANATMTTGVITGTGTVDFPDGGGGKNLTLAVNTGSNNAQFDGIFSNSGTSLGPTVLNLRKDGAGTYILTGNNTYSGTTLVNGGVLQIGNGGATGRLGSGAITVASNDTLNFNLNTATSFSNGFNFSAAGATIANRSSTSSAMITLSGGVNAGTNSNTILDGGTAGITVSGAATPSGSGAGVWTKGDVTFTGNDLNTLVIASVGSGSTMRFKTIATPWWFGSTNVTNAPNIVVDAGVTVSQNVSQAAGNLFYNNLSGSGTINIAGSAATHTILGESSVANLNATSNIALVVGQGGASGSITSGNITANNGITLNSTSSYIFSGVLAGTTLTKQNTNTVTLTGTNTYSGTTTISGGILQLGNNGTSGSISTGNIVNNGTFSINRSDNITLANAISGTGIVNKLNNTTATFTNNNSYTGATNITGTLVLQNNAPSSSSTSYKGTGQLRIESAGNDFTSTFSTSGWTFDSTITGLTIGKTVNTANITIGSVTKIAGPISVYGGTITAAENISTTVANATILLKGTADINLSASKQISTNNAPVILWANSDGQTTNGMIDFDLDASITTNGGPIWIGGGSGTSTWNSLTVGNGYAVSGKTVISPVSGAADWIAGVSFKRNTLNSNGGDIAIYGQSNQTLGIGVCTHRNVSVLSGNGRITIEGHNAQSDARNGFLWGMHNGNIGSETSLVTLNSSSNTNNGHAIYLNASHGNSNRAAAGLNQLRLNATGSASVYIKGVNNGGGIGLQLGTAEILASSGSIQVETGPSTLDGGFGQFDVPNTGSSSIGFKTGSAIASSSSNITIIANALTNLTNLNFRTTGTLTIRPQDNGSFSNTINTNTFTYSSGISGLTIGTPTNTSRINFASVTNIAGPILVYGDTLAVNENILSSNGSSISFFGNALIIGSDKTLTSNNGQLIIAPRIASNTIGLGGASGTLSLPASYFSTNFSDGFSNIQIGSNSQTGAISTNAFTLRDNMTFLTSGSLTLGGKPVLGNNNVTLGSGITTIHVGSPANYFQTNGTGNVIRNIANNTNLLFPVGRTAYNPISINNKTGLLDTFSVNVLDTTYLNGFSGGAISNNYVKRTWNISKNTASANAGSGVDLSFTWNADEVVGNLVNPTLNHHNGSGWEIPTMGISSVSGTTLTYTGYKGTFSPFAIGGSSVFALPVELKTFKATCQSDYIQIDWTTASEIRNKAFELYKSNDTKDWKLIHTIEGQGDKATETHYQFNDLDKKESYYRLKDIDEDGVENWSQIIFADCKNDASEVQIYPNPASDFIKVVVPQFENTTLKIINLEGKIIKTIPLISNQMMVSIKDLTTGVYIIEIDNLNQKYTHQILKN